MAFRPYVPDYALRLLAGRGGEPPPFARRADTAVLFVDIAGFTPMSASLAAAGPYGAEELSDLLNAVFDRVTGLVGSYGGTVAKFAGDAVTAVFPAQPGARAAAARRAVQCALDLQAAMAEFRAVATTAGAFALAMRAGVGAGGALLAVVGDRAVQLEHLVAGEAVDRAAAASRVAGRGEVAVDPALAAASDLGVELGERRGGAAVVARLTRRPRRPSPPAAAALPDDEFLAAFLHPAIAERVRRGQGGLVNEHRTVTVAFVGFPNLLSGGPERPPATRRRATAGRPVRVPPALERLQEYVAAAGVAVRRWGGHLRQVDLGDKGGVLVLAFGAPLRHEDHEERAVRCCLELLELPGGPFRAGVTTGVVWCGEVGSDARREYAVVGDSVNLAARLMEEAESGQLLLDHPTWERASGAAVGHRLRPVTVRGRSGTVTVWAVEEVRDRADPPGRPDAPGLVGRRAELAAALAAVRRLAAGDGGVLGLGGEPGIGKSRLANEAVALARDLGVETWTGACRSLGTGASYLVWRPIWQGLLGLDPSRPLAEQQAVLGERLGQRAPLLAPVVNLPLPDTELTALLDPSVRAELLRSFLLDLLRERAAAAPLLLVLEDLHWVDTPSRQLLAFLARNLADLPVLLLLTARPVDGGPDPFEPVARLPRFTAVTLEELPPAEAAELASQRMRQLYGTGREPPAGALDRVVARAGGNPFYLEELVSLIHARGGAGEDLPDSVQRVVMARIDQLAEAEKAVVKVASVLGRRFRAGWIAGSYPAIGPGEEVIGHLRRLEALRLTAVQEAGPEPEYAFRHAITQEVAYESLTLRTREALHEGVGAYIEVAYADRLPQFVERLAYHYGRTRRTDKQRIWFRAAADAARAAFANEAAVDYYERLLDLVPEAEAGPVLLDLGSVWHLVGRWAEAEQAYRRAMAIAQAAGDRSLLAASHRELGNLFMYTQSYAEAIEWLTLASEEFQLLDDPAGLARALDRLAYALIQQGSYKEAAEVAERHLAIAGEAGDPAAVGTALDHIGLVCAYTGDQAGALEYLGRSLEMASAAGDRRGVIDAANNLGGFYATSGDHVNALACFQRALASAQEIGYRQPAAVVVGNIGELYYLRGEYDRATRCFAHALRIAVELGDSTSVANRVASLAATAAARGDAATAERRYARAIELARELEAPHFLCQWLYDLAELLAAAGRRREAEPLDTEAQAVAARHSERGTELRARLLATRLRVEEGRLAPEDAALELLPQQRAWTRPSPERAAILAEMARLGPAWDRERAAAAALYLDLYQRAPNVQYRHAYQQLTGTELPPGPPLPPPPAGVGPGGDVEELLAQVEQLTATRPLAAAS